MTVLPVVSGLLFSVRTQTIYLFLFGKRSIDRVGQLLKLKTMDEVIGRLFLLNYLLGTNSTVKPFQQLGVAKSTIYKVLQNLANWGATGKQICKWAACGEAHQEDEKAACQCGNGQWWSQLDKKKNAEKMGAHEICVQRVFKWEELKYYKRKFPKADS